jgi:methylamine---glutamate N-methyltransferase subunit A
MCGIVGLFCKQPQLQPQLGELLADMLNTMRDRGPDSAGFAIYGGSDPAGTVKLTLRGTGDTDFAAVSAALTRETGVETDMVIRDTHAVFSLPEVQEATVRAALARLAPAVSVVGTGKRMELYKEVGLPDDVARRFGLQTMTGTHGIGHTRMATESAVTTDGAHPYTTGRDQCLVHNGSLSNHASLRRILVREGLRFETDNDTEVAAGYLSWRMRQGDRLVEALEACLRDLDGFYTFVVGTETGFAVLRDPVSCKPAVMAETDAWVAFGSEYRALVNLPGIEDARVWEPEPSRVYAWELAS